MAVSCCLLIFLDCKAYFPWMLAGRCMAYAILFYFNKEFYRIVISQIESMENDKKNYETEKKSSEIQMLKWLNPNSKLFLSSYFKLYINYVVDFFLLFYFAVVETCREVHFVWPQR